MRIRISWIGGPLQSLFVDCVLGSDACTVRRRSDCKSEPFQEAFSMAWQAAFRL